jgi:hypothetical protein
MIRALAALALAGCAARDVVASGVLDDSPDACRGPTPIILRGPPDPVTAHAAPVCTGTIAVQSFAHALCTCEGYAASTALRTDSFDSAAGPYAPGGTLGDVGVDGELRLSATATVGGALTASGTAGASLLADLRVARDLAIAGPLSGAVTVTAGGDAHLGGGVDLTALTVAGTLTLPAAAPTAGAITAGATVRAPVTVPPPCACDPADLVDLPGFVAAHATANNDAQIGLAPDRLTGYHGPVALDLPCGIYYVGPVSGDGALTIRVTGKVALLVAGDLALTAPLAIELATEDAELDLMIDGLLSSNQALVIGRADHPARTRVYVAGAGTIDLSGDAQLAANLYAPHAAVALAADTTVYGSLFVRRIDQAAPLAIHYDADVRRADVACPL